MGDEGCAAEERRQPAHVENLGVIGRDRGSEVQADLVAADRGPVDGQLDAAVPGLAQVQECDSGEATRRLVGDRDDRVLDVLVVEGELDSHPLIEQPRIEADLGLLAHLGLQVQIPDVLGRDATLTRGADLGRVGLNRREHIRRQAGATPRAPQLELREQLGLGEEGLFRQYPGEAELGIDNGVEVRPEGAVAVPPDCTGQKEAVLVGQLFLTVDPQVLVLEEGL